MITTKKLAAATLTALALASLGTQAMAFPAQATANVNVRTGPGTNFSILDQLTTNENVEVVECTSSNWCYVDQNGVDGWVSKNFLRDMTPPPPPPPTPTPPPPSSSNCRFEVSVGSGRPQFNLVCDNPTPPAPTPPAPTPASNTACFYTGQNFSGLEFCNGVGDLPTLGSSFNDTISSVKINGNVTVRLCDNAFLGGTCVETTTNRANLGAADNRASSIKIFETPAAPVVPSVRSQGPIALQQTFRVNLDNGNIGNAGADVWFQAVNAVQKYLTPVNGAQLALGDGSNRNYLQCQAETFSSDRLSLGLINPGSFICVKTNQGRISRIRIDSYAPATINMRHRTWQ